MTQYWEPGTQYNLGDVVQYEGHNYKIIQAHRSQSDWAPSIVPALWGRTQDGGNNNQYHEQASQQQHQQYQQQQPQQTPSHQQSQDQGQLQQGQAHSDHQQPAKQEEKKGWFSEHKTELGIAGAVLGGAAVLGGGFAAFKHHEHSEENKKTHSNWVYEARARTKEYRVGADAAWIFAQNKGIPDGAIVVAREHDWNLYICRTYCDGGIQVGKASNVFKKGAVIGYKNDEIHLEAYEVLVGNMNRLRWVPTSGKLNAHGLGYRPVEGGHENDGSALFIARAEHKGVRHPGKASEKLDGAYIPYGGKEVNVKNYEVLCYNN
jgi:hypothetical protein